MLREYGVYPWHFGGPEEFYPSETNEMIRDMRQVRKDSAAAQKAMRG